MSIESHDTTTSSRVMLALVPHPRPTEQPAADVSPLELLACYGRQADELAAMVEASIAEEDADYTRAQAALRERHRRRSVAWAVLADALGEQHAALEELALRLRPTSTDLTSPTGDPGVGGGS